jgi:FkbM family methyltransferase
MDIAKICRKVGEFTKAIIVIAKMWGLRRAIGTFIFNVICNISPPPHKEEIIVTRNGQKMYIIPYDRGISRELKIFKVHEPMATKVLIKELTRLRKLTNNLTVIDVGSNIGYYSILEAKLLDRDGTVITIEPIRRNFRYLLKNITINNITNIRAINVALSDTIGFKKMVNNVGSNWARILENENHNHNASLETVRVTTGDSLFWALEKISLIRMDVEGHEYYIIKGFYNIIKKHMPDLLIEVHPTLLGKNKLYNLLCMFRNLGYKVKHFIPRNIDVPLASCEDDIEVVDLNKLISNIPEWPFTLYLARATSNNRVFTILKSEGIGLDIFRKRKVIGICAGKILENSIQGIHVHALLNMQLLKEKLDEEL